MWINDPDETAHAQGIGSDLTRRALSLVDGGLGRIEDTLRARGLLDHTNILVTSDHGFSTHTGTLKLETPVEPFAKSLPDGSKDIIVAEGAIHFRTPIPADSPGWWPRCNDDQRSALFSRERSGGPMPDGTAVSDRQPCD